MSAADTALPQAPWAVALMGPTASGKTTLAMDLARHVPLEIISADSAQIFRGLDVGTAKPTLAQREAVPHHLLDVVTPFDAYSMARFQEDATTAIAAVLERGRVPLVVGGTLMYVKTLEQGLTALPGADEALRARLRHEAHAMGLDFLHQRLARCDPQSAARIHPHDAQRIERALEVFELTGKPLSAWHEQGAGQGRVRLVKLGLWPVQRADLHRRVRERLGEMMRAGWFEEAAGFYHDPRFHHDLPAARLIGYRQLWPCFAGHVTRERAVADVARASNALVRRQLTLLRAWPGVDWFAAEGGNLPQRLLQHPVWSQVA